MGKFIKGVGYVLLAVAVVIMIASYIMIVLTEGFGRLQEILSPFNVWNFVATLIALAPGAALVWLGDYLTSRKSRG